MEPRVLLLGKVGNFEYGNFNIEKFNFENGKFEFEFNFELDMGRGCYDPVLPHFSCLFVEIKFELTVIFCQNNKLRSSRIRIRNNPPLSYFFICNYFTHVNHLVLSRNKTQIKSIKYNARAVCCY